MARKTLKTRRAVPAAEPDRPTDEELLCYFDEALTPKDLPEMERRLFSSPYCLDRLWIIREVLGEAAGGR